jgi:methyl-accepting chemotaxis protein
MKGNFFTRSLFVKVSCIVAAVALIGVAIEAGVSAARIMDIMEGAAVGTLTDAVDSKAETIKEYVDQQYRILDDYVVNSDMAQLIDDPENTEVQARAEDFTLKMSATIKNLDSLLFTDYPGTARTHNVPDLVGYQNDADTVAMIQGVYFMDPPNPQYMMASIASPATGNVTLLFCKSLYKTNNDPAGYVALGLTAQKINDLLGSIKLGGNQEVQLLATSQGSATVIYDTDLSLVTTTLESGPMFDVASNIGVEGVTVPETDVVSYVSARTGQKMLGYYRYMPEYGWLIFAASDEATLYKEAKSAATQIIVIAAIVLAFIVVSLTLIIKKLLNPLTNVQGALTEVAGYNLNVGNRLEKYKKKDDEIGKLANATSDVVDMLKSAVGVLRNSSDSLNSSSAELDETSRRLVNVVNENSSITQNFSSGIDRTTSSVRMVEDEINKIVTLVENVGNKVRQGENDSEALIGNAKLMNDKVNENIEANAKTMDETLVSMQQAMESLEAVKKINELADAIMSITSQTNLLSLNASIEAARAGEAGRGFAVVASEIGQLAEQSKETAMNIQKIVQESNDAVDNVKAQVDKLTGYVRNDVTQTYQGFAEQSSEYGEGIGNIRNTVDEIGDAMKALGDSVNQIAKEITAVTAASEENSNGVNDIITKNDETNRITGDIEKLAGTSRANADDLEAVVNKFKL